MPRKSSYDTLYVKRELVGLESGILSDIASGIASGAGKKAVMDKVRSRVRSLAVHMHLDQDEAMTLVAKAGADYDSARKAAFASLARVRRKKGTISSEKERELRNQAAYDAIRAKIRSNDPIREANMIASMYERRKKRDGLRDLLTEARSVNGSPFFISSSHPHPASGHAEWEGKLYYDGSWESYVSPEDRAACADLIRDRGMRTVQWVTGAPIWLTTRRNCRHFLRNVPISDALALSEGQLVGKFRMMEPNREPKSRKILNYRWYKDRKRVEEALMEAIPCKRLRQDLSETSKMMGKWAGTL